MRNGKFWRISFSFFNCALKVCETKFDMENALTPGMKPAKAINDKEKMCISIWYMLFEKF